MASRMIVAITSDWHIDATTAGVARFHEITQFCSSFADEMTTNQVELLLFLGDMFDSGRDDLRWAAHSIMLARELSGAASVAALWMAGNHDVVDRDEVITSLSPLREARSLTDNNMIIAETPSVHHVIGEQMEVVILALPYPSKSDVDSWKDQVEKAISMIPDGATVIVASHLCVEGAAMGSETRDMARGTDVYLQAEWLDRVKPALVVNGHYHRRQVVECGAHQVHIPGSPVRLRFDEAEEAHKGGFIVVLEQGTGDNVDEDDKLET